MKSFFFPDLPFIPNKSLLTMATLSGIFLLSHSSLALTYVDSDPSNVWDLTTTNWNDGISNVAWTNPSNNASFGGVAETVSINSAIIGTSMTFTVAGYNLTSGGGSLSLSSNITASVSGTTTVSSDLTLSAAGAQNFTAIGGHLVFSGNITKSTGVLNLAGGTSVFTLSGSNTLGGGINFSNTTIRLNIGNAYALGSGTMTINANSASIDNTSGAPMTIATNNPIVISPASGNGLTFVGTNNLNLGTGAITLSGASQAINANSGTLTIGGSIGESGGSRGITKGGAGVLVLNGSNSFSGTTRVSAGLLNIGNANALGSNALFGISGNSSFDNTTGAALTVFQGLAMTGGSPTFVGSNNMTFSGSSLISGAATRTITTTSGTLTLSGGVGEDVAGRNLTKAGPGTLVLSGSSTYTGNTTVSAGTLLLNNTAGSATGAGAVQVNAGTLGGSGSVTGAVTVGNGAGGNDSFLTPGATPASGVVGKLTTASSLTLASDSRVIMDINAVGTRGVNYDALDVGSLAYGGSLALNITTGIGSGTYDLFAVTGAATQGLVSVVFTGGFYSSTWAETTPTSGIWTTTSGGTTFTFDEATGDMVVSIPEPTTSVLVGTGLAVLLSFKRRRANA